MAIRGKTERPKIIVQNFHVVAMHDNPAYRWCAVGAKVQVKPASDGKAFIASTFGLDPAGLPNIDPAGAITSLYHREGFHSIQIQKELATTEE